MLATSTHDNKRSEDVRARIDVISEKVPEWRLQLRKWRRINESRKAEVDGQMAPSPNDEYLLYQVLLGSFPIGSKHDEMKPYIERIVAYMQKATREAKQRTSWANVNEPYEAATTGFVRALLEDHAGNAFLADLRVSAEPVAWIGFLNGLSMVMVKMTSPGVPDIYQGNETWDFSLVDPDNRRPVDYSRRRAMLQSIETTMKSPEAIGAMLKDLPDGRAKLYVTWKLLQLRKAREALFLQGGYTAVHASGTHAKNLVAFARRHGGEAIVTVAPRLIGGLGITPGKLPCGADCWGDTRIALPFFKDGTVVHDILSGREHCVTGGGLALAALLVDFPGAVLSL